MPKMEITSLLDACIRMDASDIHISPGKAPCLRLHGEITPLETIPVTEEIAVQLMKAITPERHQQELMEEGTTEFGFDYTEAARRFRCSIYKTRQGTCMVLRLVPKDILTCQELGLPPKVSEIVLSKARGIFFVTGPTGSGKSTTLAALIHLINSTQACKIVTFEDPIEYVHTHRRAIIEQREVGTHLVGYIDGIHRVLRQDPNVILLGELRNLDTMEAALRAAETGHLVFATLHTRGCSSAINRVIDAFPEIQQNQIKTQLAMSLLGVLSQILVPRKGPGRVAAFEFMYTDNGIRSMIMQDKPVQIDSHIRTHTGKGMMLMDDHLFRMVEAKVITRETAIEYARNTAEMEERLSR